MVELIKIENSIRDYHRNDLIQFYYNVLKKENNKYSVFQIESIQKCYLYIFDSEFIEEKIIKIENYCIENEKKIIYIIDSINFINILKERYKNIKIKKLRCNNIYLYVISIEKPFINYRIAYFKNNDLVVNRIKYKDKKKYYDLYTDEENNKYWGYDYKKDLKKIKNSSFYFLQKKDYKLRNNICYAIRDRKTNEMIGEVILHHFTYDGGVEIGIRLFKSYQRKGIGTKVIRNIKKQIEDNNMYACMKVNSDNIGSKKAIINSGFIFEKKEGIIEIYK